MVKATKRGHKGTGSLVTLHMPYQIPTESTFRIGNVGHGTQSGSVCSDPLIRLLLMFQNDASIKSRFSLPPCIIFVQSKETNSLLFQHKHAFV